MIERLMNLEHPYGEPQYRNLSEQIISLKQQLFSQLNRQGKNQLDQLTGNYLAQLAALREAAFIDGFCSAVDLMIDYLEHKTTGCSKANQERPPES